MRIFFDKVSVKVLSPFLNWDTIDFEEFFIYLRYNDYLSSAYYVLVDGAGQWTNEPFTPESLPLNSRHSGGRESQIN